MSPRIYVNAFAVLVSHFRFAISCHQSLSSNHMGAVGTAPCLKVPAATYLGSSISTESVVSSSSTSTTTMIRRIRRRKKRAEERNNNVNQRSNGNSCSSSEHHHSSPAPRLCHPYNFWSYGLRSTSLDLAHSRYIRAVLTYGAGPQFGAHDGMY